MMARGVRCPMLLLPAISPAMKPQSIHDYAGEIIQIKHNGKQCDRFQKRHECMRARVHLQTTSKITVPSSPTRALN